MRATWFQGLFVVLLLTGCVTSKPAVIETVPPGAAIHVNNAYIGDSPVTYVFVDDNTPGVWDNYVVRATKDGYRPSERVLKDQLGSAWMPDKVSLHLEPLTTAPVATTPSAPQTASAAPPARNPEPAIIFPRGPERPDDIGVVIGNRNYGKFGGDVPDVDPAHADADLFKRFLVESQGLRDGNIIDLRDATGSQMRRVFGTDTDPHGQLFDWVRSGVSRVWVYYAGHGAPGEGGTSYLVPADGDSQRISLNGFPLDVLYRNLGALPATRVTAVIEACFSGLSQAGPVVSNSSALYLKPREAQVPPNITVISASALDQVASWEQDGGQSLFTKYFLKGMASDADRGRYGNGDGTVSWTEIDGYLRDTVTYYARRYYGRDQTAQIVAGN